MMIGTDDRDLIADLIKWGRSLQKYEETKHKNPLIAQMLIDDGEELQRELSQNIKERSLHLAIKSLKEIESFIDQMLLDYEKDRSLSIRHRLANASNKAALEHVQLYITNYRERLEEYIEGDG